MSINKIVNKEKKWHDERYRDGEDKRININIASRIAWYPYSKFYKKIKDINSAKVLEIGCGNSLLKAKQLISQGCRYTGIDISEECINANIKDASKLGLNVNYLVDDAHVLNKLRKV